MRDNVIPLDVLNGGKAANSAAAGGCTSGGCGGGTAGDDLPPEVWAKVKNHPCYAEEAHHYFARMHVAVAPACNIQCNYCNRKFDCANESRPGVVSERLTPDEALRKVLAVAAAVPELAVLGIAGPGDAAYDWARSKATFEMVRAHLPDLTLCLSSNGLALPEHVDELVELGVAHVTLTINMIDPAVGEAIYPWIFWQHARRTGREASRILHERQMESLERLVAAGVLVKVNSVLIPGINDDHLAEVNALVKAKGAFLHNVVPLISAAEHGTVFGLEGQRGPTAQELETVQESLAGGARLMRHCRQCRADAVGLLGEDRGHEFALENLPEPVAPDPSAREAYRTWAEAERAARRDAAAAAASEPAVVDEAEPLLAAVCSRSGGRINQHFGQATEFQVFEVDATGVRFVGRRRCDNYCVHCDGGFGEDERLEAIVAALDGISLVLCAKIGEVPRARLETAGIEPIERFAQDYIETALTTLYRERTAAATETPLTA